MKIGIITFHRAHNYGAVLQCYALSASVKKLGHSVEVVDYYPRYFRNQYNLFPSMGKSVISWLKGMVKTIPILSVKNQRIKLFNEFIDELPLSEQRYDEKVQNINGYDILIFGSDQIWNPLLSDGVDAIYSGFFHHRATKFVSYAASTNPAICNETYKEYFNRIICSFDNISVREKSFSDYLNLILPHASTTVLDPVLLLSADEWSTKIIAPKETNYLLIYTVPQSPLVREHAEIMARKLGLQIIEITPIVRNTNDRTIRQAVSPKQFLGYFKYASYIVTTSFHGTSFSIKFEKQFSTIQLGSFVDDRAFNLLQSVGLQERAVTRQNVSHALGKIDYNEVNRQLESLIKDSLLYLTNCLNNNN